MDLQLETFSSITATPGYGRYECALTIEGVDEETVINQLTQQDHLNHVISQIDLKDVIQYHGVEEILETIGEQRVKEHVAEYWTQSDEEHE